MSTREQDQWIARNAGVASLLKSRKDDGAIPAHPPKGDAVSADPAGDVQQPASAPTSVAPGALVIDEFVTDSADIPKKHLEALKALRAKLIASPDATAVLTGHADTVGKEAYNKGLGERRAKAVRDFLSRDRGPDPSRLKVDSAGETVPAPGQAPAKLDPDKGEANPKNRRVVIEITGRAPAASPGPTTAPTGTDPKTDPGKPGGKPPIGLPRLPKDYKVDPDPDPDSPELDPRMWKPIPSGKGGGKSVLEWVDETVVDPVLDKVSDTFKLSKKHRDELKKKAHDAVESGASAGAGAAAAAMGVDKDGQEAIKKAVEAAIKYKKDQAKKPGGTP